ncbi:hypothetical protein M3Y94_00773200 [Aphelenchoides besseyi]|nr:hypothetical protein M3Y94_00773200 [Aphelenchoides besseyi]
MFLTHFLIASFFILSSVHSQRPSRPSTSKVKVIPQCSKDTIVVQVEFDGRHFTNNRFTDWIIVGDSGRSECRLRGNGELHYVVTIAVFNDQCGTQMPAPGEFQNTLRIAQFPGVILSDDLHFTFKCTYGVFNHLDFNQQTSFVGRPEVVEFQLPQVSPSFDVNRNLVSNDLTTVSPILFNGANVADNTRSQPFPGINQQTDEDTNDLLLGHNFNRDDITGSANISRASNNLLAILFSALVIVGILVFLLILYICYRQVRARKGRHDPMQAESGTPSSISPGVTNQDEDGPWWNTKPISGSYLLGSSFKNKNFENRKRNVAPMPPYSAGSLNLEIERAVDVNFGPEHQFQEAFRRNGNSSSNTDEQDGNNTRTPQSYAEWREKVLRKSTSQTTQDRHSTLDRKPSTNVDNLDVDPISPGSCLTPVRSITEIYKSAETHLKMMAEDDRSESSIEGEYSIPIQKLPLEKEFRERLVQCVNKIRGFGNRRLTEQELGRWKQLISNDAQLQIHVMQARSLDELKAIAELSEYRLFFTRTKWQEIMNCVHETLYVMRTSQPLSTHRIDVDSLDGDSSTLNNHRPQRTERSNW